MPKKQSKSEILKKVLSDLVDHAAQDVDMFDEVCLMVNNLLDDLASSDFFGTERQCDPRGDGRNKRGTQSISELLEGKT